MNPANRKPASVNTTLCLGLFSLFISSDALWAQTCVHAYDFYGAPATVPTAFLGPVRILHAVDAFGVPSLLEIMDCDGDSLLDVSIPWSEAGASPPAAVRFGPVCAGNQPRYVSITFHQSVPTVTWRAFATLTGPPFAVQYTFGTGYHTVTFNHPLGIQLVKIKGAEIFVTEVCWSCEQHPNPQGDPADPQEAPPFVRGDVTGDGEVNMTDAVKLEELILGSEAPDCLDAADVNDDGQADVQDVTQLLAFLLRGDSPPPGNLECGPDETEDGLDCQKPLSCIGPGDPVPTEQI